MNTQAFINLLENNEDLVLHFDYPDQANEKRIPATYHITEIKNHVVTSVDCGGNKHNFTETVVQLYVNPNESYRKAWTTNKALSIVNIVNESHPIDKSSDLLFEFGPNGHERMLYQISHFDKTDNELVVHLNHTAAVCKPQLANAGLPGLKASCC